MASNSSEQPWVPMQLGGSKKLGYEEVFKGLGYSEDQISRIMYALRIQHSDPIEFEEISTQIKKEREEEAQAYIKSFSLDKVQKDSLNHSEDAKSSTSTVDDNSSAEQQVGGEAERVEEQSHSISAEFKRDRLAFDS